MHPNRKDLRKLKSIESMSDNLSSAYLGLSAETKEFLLNRFTGETELHLRQFSQNISETVEELKKPVKKAKK